MAKIMVMIEIPDKSYDDLMDEVVNLQRWHFPGTEFIGIPQEYIKFTKTKPGNKLRLFCELIGVRP